MSRNLGFGALALLAFAATFALVKVLQREAPPPPGMVWVPGGEFTMGSDAPDVSAHERPAHLVHVNGFWMDETDVTNAQFRAFVEATGYRTTAEIAPTLEDIMRNAPPGASPPKKEDLVPGSLVFTPPDHPVPLNDVSGWVKWT